MGMLINVLFKSIKFSINNLKSKITPSGYVLIHITIISMFLRVLEVNPGAPFLSPDEPIIKDSAIRIALDFNFKPVGFYYGQLLPILYAIFDWIFFIPLLFLKFFITHIKFFIDHGIFFSIDFFRKNILLSSDPTNYFHYAARYSSAIISAFTVIPVYFLGKRLFNKKVGLVTAFLLAVNYRHLLSSNVVLADAPAAFFSSLSVLLSVILLKDRSKKAYILAGCGIALSLSVKYFFYVIPVFFLCHLFGIIAKKIPLGKKIKETVLNKNLALSLMVCVVLFLAINPYFALDTQTARTEFFLNSQRYGLISYKPNLFDLTRGDTSLIPFYYLFWIGLTPLISIFAVAGFIYGLFKFTKGTLILSSIILPFLFVFSCVFGDPFFRNFSAIIPFIMFFPAIAIIGFSSKFKKTHALCIIVLMVAIVSFASVKKSLITTLDYMKPHNEVVFGKWIDKNFPEDKVGSFMAMQILRDKGVLEIGRNYSIYKSEQIPSVNEMNNRDIEYIAVSSYKSPVKNRSIWLDRHLVVKGFFNNDLFWNNIENTYDSLLLSELNQYSVVQFLKTFDLALDRAIFVAKIPDFSNVDLNNKVSPIFMDKLTHTNLKEVALNTYKCDFGITIASSKLNVEENRLYSFTGQGKSDGGIFSGDNGFLRLDFYSKDSVKLKTYVSGLLKNNNDWQKLVVMGIAPESSTFAVVGMQVDKCLTGKILFKNLDVSFSDKSFIFDKEEYPFYDQKVPRNFLWSSEN